MLEVIKVPIADIIPYENNPKEHSQEQVEQIIQSIREYGNNDPIAIDENNVMELNSVYFDLQHHFGRNSTERKRFYLNKSECVPVRS